MTATVQARAPRDLLRWWPAAAGVGVAAVAGFDVAEDGGVGLAPVLAASAVIYLGAAALGRPRAAWPLFFGAFAVLAVAGAYATWALLGAAVLLAGYGLLRGVVRGLPLQAVATAGFGGAAALALVVSPELGAHLVATGLLGHAVWDVHHHRTGRVVTRSLAEFCAVLDTLLAVAITVATLVA
ncbi:MAG TPA: hypothetical protein VKZ81_15525 [Pseudonocardia sp.]|jgi:hypothetical protein|uniref:hypothetical protein n=1 Tax=Pseudonocardia sp. TaxID=60912 RepID=UPI002B4B1902|nr:hypothetical protein [Pseudonocardia sp.]HLU56868.1 hypothetical protein [Pseudonocardia sp.]